MKFTYYANACTLSVTKKFSVSIFRYQRSAYFRWEHYADGQARFFNLTIGSPHAHRWWAFSLFVYY